MSFLRRGAVSGRDSAKRRAKSRRLLVELLESRSMLSVAPLPGFAAELAEEVPPPMVRVVSGAWTGPVAWESNAAAVSLAELRVTTGAPVGTGGAAADAPALSGGTWTKLTSSAPSGIGTMMLLSDGRVMAQASGTSSAWYALTPNSTGSYLNGGWSSLASMGTARLYFGSNVLPSGKVFLVGGEYSGPSGTQNFANTGELYDPVANSWSPIAPFPRSQFGDDPTAVLPNGTVLAGYISGAQTYIYNPTTNTWSQTGTKLRGDRSDEETWATLPDGSILSYDVFASPSSGAGHAQKYVPATQTWVDAGSVPVPLSGSALGFELGPTLRLPDGRYLQIGANSNTALYSPSTNTWAAGPIIPNSKGADDAPAAELPNGHVIFTADTPVFNGPTQLFDFDPTTNTITQFVSLPAQLTSDLAGAAYHDRMLVLPTGQVLLATGSNRVWLFNPTDSPLAASKPTISSVTQNGDGTYTLTGTQLNGISEGASYGDDAEMASNYPIVRLTDGSSHVYYARTFNWSSTAVATGNTPVTTQFALPAGLPSASYSLVVIANGIASAAVTFDAPLAVAAASPAAGSVVSTSPANYVVQFTGPIDPASLLPSDLTVNSQPASGASLSADHLTATFTFTTDPVIAQGLQSMAMAAGAVTAANSATVTNSALSTQFRYDAQVLQVTSTSPPVGGVFTLPGPFTFDVNFNEPINPASLSSASLVLAGIPGAAVTNLTMLPGNTTARFTIGGITTEGQLSASIAAGAATDVFGNPGLAFNGAYSTDIGIVALPVPVTLVTPFGALIYSRSSDGSIASTNDSDTYTLNVNPGQSISVVITPADAFLQPSVQLRDPGNAIAGSGNATAGGFAAIVQAAIPDYGTAGTYRIIVSGLLGSLGPYALKVTLNAAVETEGLGPGTQNNTLATAQDVTATATILGAGSATRIGLVGRTDAGVGGQATPDYYAFFAAAGDTDTLAATSQAAGNVNLDLFDGNGNLLASGIAGAANVSRAISRFTFPADGAYYARLSGDPSVAYSVIITQNAIFDTEPNDSFATAQNLDGTGGVSGAVTGGNDDWYAITIAGPVQQLRLVTYTPSDGPGQFANTLAPAIELYDPAGVQIGAGTLSADGRNQSLTRVEYAPGVYRVHVTAANGTQGEYFLSAALTPAATLQTVTIDNGTNQRSLVRSITVDFGGVIASAPSAAFTLTRVEDNLSIPLTASALIPLPAGDTRVVLTVGGPALDLDSIPNGNYVLSIDGSPILDDLGQQLDAAGNGTPGSLQTVAFFRLFADANGDGVVNGQDISLAAENWLGPGPDGDINGDGIVNGQDFSAIAANWLSTVGGGPGLAGNSVAPGAASGGSSVANRAKCTDAVLAASAAPGALHKIPRGWHDLASRDDRQSGLRGPWRLPRR